MKSNSFALRTRTEDYTKDQFFNYFVLVDKSEIDRKLFSVWIQDTKEGATEWGCEKSETVTKIVKYGAGGSASVKASGGFFSFFEGEAKASTTSGTETTKTYTKTLSDSEWKHRVTYWKLKAVKKSKTLLYIALEKTSLCDKNKGVINNYSIKFEKQLNHDDQPFQGSTSIYSFLQLV